MIVDRSYEPQYGARPIRRFVEQELVYANRDGSVKKRRGDSGDSRDIYVRWWCFRWRWLFVIDGGDGVVDGEEVVAEL